MQILKKYINNFLVKLEFLVQDLKIKSYNNHIKKYQ